MSARDGVSPPAHPAVTTTTTDHSSTSAKTTISTTTATTINPEKATPAPPSLAPRPVGWHAIASGFDWNKRSDQHRYRLTSGLPEIHAAVINHDWDTAGEMLCAEDIGLLWLPPVSQRYSAAVGNNTENGSWALKLPSKHQSTQLEAIRQMAIDRATTTGVYRTCVYGANLLTLCLQTSAPQEFMEKLLSMTKKHVPQYLNLSDASGRTPLYIAVERGDINQLAMLLGAGANPLTSYDFQMLTKHGKAPEHAKKNALQMNVYTHALNSPNDRIFRMLLANVLNGSNWGAEYPFLEDPLHLKTWASTRTENEIRDLASQFDCLKTVLFNAKNKSGSSLVDRHLTQKEPLPEGVIPLFAEDPKLGAIHAAAVFADINAFTRTLSNYCLQRKPIPGPEKFFIEDFIATFLENCSLADIPQLWTLCSQLEPVINYVAASPRNLLSLPFERFSVLTTVIWPFLSQEERTTLIVTSKYVDPSYNFLLMQLS